MKTLYFIVVIVFGFTIATSCSDGDEEKNPIVEKTFLEKYKETVWHIALNEFSSEYVQFDNNEAFPFKLYSLMHGFGCYDVYNYNLITFKAKITENTEDILQISFEDGDVWIIGVEGNELHWVDVTEEGFTDYVYSRQNAEVLDGLALCFP